MGSENMIEAFKEYVSHYDLSNDKIKRKLEHSLRVMELQTKYAKMLNFSKEDIEIATIIGLLHDFGRFEQVRLYDSFNDLETVDHADYSVEQLFEKGKIKDFTTHEEWYSIIRFAIKNHNKIAIPECHDERMLKHAKLIRDIDKLDIMYLLGLEIKVVPDESPISDEVLEDIKKHTIVNRRYAKTLNDRIAIQYAFAFDINYDVVLEEYKKNFITFHKLLDRGEQFAKIYQEVIDYLDERMEKNERD